MRVVAVIPTRGLVFTDCIGAVYGELKGIEVLHDTNIIFSERLGIPEAHENLCEVALNRLEADYVWIVEEDVIPPLYSLAQMIETGEDIVTIDVPGRHFKGQSQTCLHGDEVMYTHTGCLLVSRKVFEAVEKPWFDTTLRLKKYGSNIKAVKVKKDARYGKQDVGFSLKAREKGFRIYMMPNLVGEHVYVQEYADHQTNSGCHQLGYISEISEKKEL